MVATVVVSAFTVFLTGILGIGLGVTCGVTQDCTWRRRLADPRAIKIIDAGEEDICYEANDHFGEYMMALKDTQNASKLRDLSGRMASFCQSKAVNTDQKAWSEYTSAVLAGETHDQRTLSLPSVYYDQCAGYAKALSVLLEKGHEDATNIFRASAKGSKAEKTNGCANVVTKVNDAIESGADERLSIVPYEREIADGKTVQAKAVVVNDVRLQHALLPFLTTLTLASGKVVMHLMDLCDYYSVHAIAA